MRAAVVTCGSGHAQSSVLCMAPVAHNWMGETWVSTGTADGDCRIGVSWHDQDPWSCRDVRLPRGRCWWYEKSVREFVVLAPLDKGGAIIQYIYTHDIMRVKPIFSTGAAQKEHTGGVGEHWRYQRRPT